MTDTLNIFYVGFSHLYLFHLESQYVHPEKRRKLFDPAHDRLSYGRFGGGAEG
jgi:hypothetical protein